MSQTSFFCDSFRSSQLIVDLTCLFVAVFVPYAVSFDEYIVNEGTFWLLGSIIVNSIYLLDLILEFLTAHYNEDMEIIVDKTIIAKHYIKTWFLIDLIGEEWRGAKDKAGFEERKTRQDSRRERRGRVRGA